MEATSRHGWQPKIGTVAAPMAILFALYCQAHSWLDGSSTSPFISLRWGLMVGAPAGVLIWHLWRDRRRWSDAFGQGLTASIVPIAKLFALILVGGSTLQLLAGGRMTDAPVTNLLARMFDLLPIAALGSAVLLAAFFGHGLRKPAENLGASPKPMADAEWLYLPEEPRLRLRISEIQLVRSAGNYCEIGTSRGLYWVRAPLKSLAERLGAESHVRVHRSAIVAVSHLLSVDQQRGRLMAMLKCGAQIPVGRSFKAALLNRVSGRPSH